MPQSIFDPLKGVTIPIKGQGKACPVGRIFCVGQNYADHAKEMGSDPARQPPFFFTKPVTAITPSGSTILYPPRTQELHYEVELAVMIGKKGFNVSPENAQGLILGYATALDMTKRDLQTQAKKAGLPWDMAKGFAQSCPCSELTLVPEVADLIGHADIELVCNGETKQKSNIQNMTWSVPEIISHLSSYEPVRLGDLILTGTPAGVGPVKRGDHIKGRITHLSDVEIRYGA